MAADELDKPSYVGKARRWQAHVSLAASGPASMPGLKSTEPLGMYPKVAAELRYTSADISFLSSHWRQPEYRVPQAFYVEGYESDYASVMAKLEQAGDFLVDGSQDAAFDGGSLIFAYSGHGREGDGTLCLHDDTYFSADDFLDACLEIRRAAPGRGRLRVALLLDSCHSGSFLLRVLERVLHEHDEDLVPDYLMASSMPDEYSFEIPALSHGLSTFCFSVRPSTLGSMVATADGGTTTWAIAAGAPGCSLVSGGRQNPVVYDAYELRVGNHAVPVWLDEGDASAVRPRVAWERDLRVARDALRAGLGPLTGLSFEPDS